MRRDYRGVGGIITSDIEPASKMNWPPQFVEIPISLPESVTSKVIQAVGLPVPISSIVASPPRGRYAPYKARGIDAMRATKAATSGSRTKFGWQPGASNTRTGEPSGSLSHGGELTAPPRSKVHVAVRNSTSEFSLLAFAEEIAKIIGSNVEIPD